MVVTWLSFITCWEIGMPRKITMNRLANINNRYQTDAHRVLCLCSAGLLRSPTAANVLHQELGFNTRAAGVSEEYALILADEVLLMWADEIVCVEQSVAARLHDFLADEVKYVNDIIPKITVLNIPDQFEWNNEELRSTILEQYTELGKAGKKEPDRSNYAGDW